jgi:16S rRNA (guanine527-N7)-methyltransferase
MLSIIKYFPNLSQEQIKSFRGMASLYQDWNRKINVISRKDIDYLYERHILHSLSIGKIINFRPDTRILDVGTGGGFPGIPLAILFPDSKFVLIDSIGKKIRVVRAIADELGLKNVIALNIRVEELKQEFDFVISRAVTAFPAFVALVTKNISGIEHNSLPNGIIYLKGGNFHEETARYRRIIEVTEISKFFNEQYFTTKRVIYLPVRR